MISSKPRKAVLAKLYEQFQLYGLTTDVSYEEYAQTVDFPVAKRVIKKGWMGRWVRAMSSLLQTYPDVNEVGNRESKKPSKVAVDPILEVRNRWRNETADPSPDPYSGVNIATIVNVHGEELAKGTDVEKAYVRGALIEMWRANKARGMDAAKTPVNEWDKWVEWCLGDLSPSDLEHLATGETIHESGLGFGHEQSNPKKDKKLSGLEALKALSAKKEADDE